MIQPFGTMFSVLAWVVVTMFLLTNALPRPPLDSLTYLRSDKAGIFTRQVDDSFSDDESTYRQAQDYYKKCVGRWMNQAVGLPELASFEEIEAAEQNCYEATNGEFEMVFEPRMRGVDIDEQLVWRRRRGGLDTNRMTVTQPQGRSNIRKLLRHISSYFRNNGGRGGSGTRNPGSLPVLPVRPRPFAPI